MIGYQTIIYQTRSAHHAVVTSDWLAQSQEAAAIESNSRDYLKSSSSNSEKPFTEAVAAILALASVIRFSKASTIMRDDSRTLTSALEYEDFDAAKLRLIERAEKFGEISRKAQRTIAMLSQDFIFDGTCFEFYAQMEDLTEQACGSLMKSGGIINMMGTYQIALVAHSMNKPVYVAAESYKVEKTFGPVNQYVPAIFMLYKALYRFHVLVIIDLQVITVARLYSTNMGTLVILVQKKLWRIVRAHCRPAIESWTIVSKSIKDGIWNNVVVSELNFFSVTLKIIMTST
ncbi:hypothetical protein MKX01_037424 [Papaver californicum]|nr:hypothetical protein MKX01_037424 [Papaver californicum]